MFTVNKNPTIADLRKFGWAMLVGFTGIGALLWLSPWLKARDAAALGWMGTGLQLAALGLLILGGGLWILSVSSPRIAAPVYVAWMTVVVPIGIVMSTVLLTLLFAFFLPVFSLIVRFGDPLRKRLKTKGSYWEDYKPHEPTLERMRRPF